MTPSKLGMPLRQILPVGLSLAILGLGLEGLGLVTPSLPEAKVVQSTLSTASDAVGQMWISHAYRAVNGSVVKESDLGDVTVGWLKDFIGSAGSFKTVSKNHKGLVSDNYEQSLPDITKLLAMAGQSSQFDFVYHITDLNTDMTATGTERKDTDFAHATFKAGGGGQQVQMLLKAGFKFNGTRLDISSQPLWNKSGDEMAPIMHEKEWHAISNSQSVGLLLGTYNPTPHPRYNRLLEIMDPAIRQYMLEHALAMRDNFHNQGEIKNVKDFPPLHVDYRDGSFNEIAFTDGKYNPNERITNLFTKATQNPKDLQVEEVIYSHFVLTNQDEFDALKALMQAQDQFKVFGIFDGKFVGYRNPGLAAAFYGIEINRPFGKSIHGLGYKLRTRFDAYVYQRSSTQNKPSDDPYTGASQVDPDGEPTDQHLWHDKTTMVKVIENGVRWTYIFTGSLNNSSHFANAENQLMTKILSGSALAQFFEASIKGTVALEPGFAVPMDKAMIRVAVADLIGHEVLEISLASLDMLFAAANNSDIDGFLKLVTLEASKKTRIVAKDRVGAADLATRLKRFKTFMDWYLGELKAEGSKYKASIYDYVDVVMLITSKNIFPGTVRSTLETILYNPTLAQDPVKLEALVKTAWGMLVTVPYSKAPPPTAPPAGGVATKNKAVAVTPSSTATPAVTPPAKLKIVPAPGRPVTQRAHTAPPIAARTTPTAKPAQTKKPNKCADLMKK
jgi:hypothetical protein